MGNSATKTSENGERKHENGDGMYAESASAPKEYDMSVVERSNGQDMKPANMVQCFGMVSHTGLFIGS